MDFKDTFMYKKVLRFVHISNSNNFNVQYTSTNIRLKLCAHAVIDYLL